jgi:NRAMP (natural resistance-associated macrophage protein)-like metal ion transporter
MSNPKPPPTHGNSHIAERFRGFFRDLGPGLITGAADDDPSGISTYSVAGAGFGYSVLWTALFSFPLMVAVQTMCARLGMVTGRGLAGVVRRRYPRWVLWGVCLILSGANVFNIAADLAGMAEGSEMVTGIRSAVWTPVYAAMIVSFLLWSSYALLARVFKWLTLVLFAYVAASFFSRPDWGAVLHYTLVPRIQWSGAYLSVFVAILGTSISPYLFFWQAAQEVEEERAMGRRTVAQRRGATPEELRKSRTDVITGMFVSNLIMYFIVLTTAATLHAHGGRAIATAREAAEALRPLAGAGAYWLFTLGLVGTGMLGVPVLAGSSAYAVSEAAAWRGSLTDRVRFSPKFYAIMGVSMALGLALDFIGMDAVRMLFLAAVANGVLAPPLVLIIVLLTNDKTVMGDLTNPLPLRIFGWIAFATMAMAAAAMFIAPR